MTGLTRLSCAGLLTVLIAAAPAPDRFRLMDQPQEICIVGGDKDGDCYRRVAELNTGVDIIDAFEKFRTLKDFGKLRLSSVERRRAIAPAIGVPRSKQAQILEHYAQLSVDHVSIDPDQGFDPQATTFDVAGRIHFKKRGVKNARVETVDIRGTVVTRNTLVRDLGLLSLATLDENNAYASDAFRLTEVSNDKITRDDIATVVVPAVLSRLWFESQKDK